MAVDKDVFLAIAPKLLANGFYITPIYHDNPNQDFKAAKIFPKGWNKFDRPELIKTEDQLELVDWDRFLCYLTLPTPGSVVLDVDTKTEEQRQTANEFIQSLRKHGAPNTFVVGTPSGGVHLYYKTPARIGVAKFAGCVDVQQPVASGASAQGCYGPGCVRAEGLSYVVQRDMDISALPDSVIEWMDFTAEQNADQVTDFKGAIDIAPAFIPKGDRDNVLSGIAASMVRKGFTKESVVEWLKFLRDTRMEGAGDFSDDLLEEKVERVLSKKEFLPEDRNAVDLLMDRLVLIRRSATVYDRVTRYEYPEQKAKVIYAKYKFLVESADGKKQIYRPAFEAWKGSELRDEADVVCYLPGEEEFFSDPVTGMTFCNNYIAPRHLVPERDCTEYVRAFEALCAHLWPEDPTYFLQYAAYLCQEESAKLEYMVVLISETKGVGKNLYSEILTNLLGSSNVATTTVTDLTSSFNSNIVDSRLVIIDEMETRFHKKDFGEVKSMITSTTLTRKEKHMSDRSQRVRFTLIGFSNRLDQLVIEDGDRRFWPIECKSGKLPKEIEEPVSPMASGKTCGMKVDYEAIAALWYHLQTVEVTNVYLRPSARPPESGTKDDVQVASMTGIAQVFAELRAQKEGAFAGDILTVPMVMLDYYQRYGERLTVPQVRSALRDNGLVRALMQQNGRSGRQVYPPKIDLDYQMMCITKDQGKEVGYACRDFDKYRGYVDPVVVKQELMKGYSKLAKGSGKMFGSADILPFPGEQQ